jgi:hypothetical protein
MLDAKLLELGAEKFVYRAASHSGESDIPELPGYRFQTTHGPLVLHPDIPWSLNKGDRLLHTVTVFGRFEGDGPFPEPANQFSGKRNFHFGSRTADELPDCIEMIANAVRRNLPAAVAA